jgi:WD40 repeat protein
VPAGSDDTKTHVWCGSSWKLLFSLEPHTNILWSIVTYKEAAHLQNRIITSSGDNTIRISDGDTGTAIHHLRVHQDQVPVLVSYQPSNTLGLRVVSASYDGTLRVWDPEAGRLIHTVKVEGPISQYFRSHLFETCSGRYHLLLGTLSGQVFCWDLGDVPARGTVVRAANKTG